MSRITTHATIDAAPVAAHPLLAKVKQQLGVVPNLFRVLASSPAALEGYLGLGGALAKGALDAPTRERLALAVAEVNGCDYCLSAHSYLAKHVAHLGEAEIAASRVGASSDPKAAAAVRLAQTIVRTRGAVAGDDLAAAKDAGLSDAELVEIVVHVALNTLTNYINLVADTAIDFPVVNHAAR